jgi:YaiO family outer membrane protein
MTVHAAWLLAALVAAGSVHDAAAGPVRDDAAEAVRLARAGAHEEALTRFRALAARNPRDLESRVWMGQLLVWTGDRAEAEQVFRRVLEDAPGTVDAMLGLGSLMTTSGRIDEALAILADAERLDRSRAETLAALGRAHRLAGRTTRALSYYERAAALSPTDADVRAGLDATRYQHGHRAGTTVTFERFPSPVPAGRAAQVALSLRLTDRVRLGLHQHVQGKFGRTESRTGAGVEWRCDRRTLVRGEVFGSAGAKVLPQADVLAEVERSGARADLVGTMRFARFSTASVWVAAPGLMVPLDEHLTIIGRYYASLTTFEQSGQSVLNHSGRLALRARVRQRLWVEGGYARGNESFETLTVDRIGRFRADTFAGGVRIDNASLASLNISAEYQRSDGRSLLRVAAGVTQRF